MPQIVVYTRTTCAPCKTVKHWLKSKGFTFSEKNVDEDPSYTQELLKQTGFMMVPLTVVDGEFVHGLNLGKLASILT